MRQKKKKKKKKKKKIKYPKNFDINNPGPLPHPERWLPKHERTLDSKGKKIKNKKQIFKGAQGQGSSEIKQIIKKEEEEKIQKKK